MDLVALSIPWILAFIAFLSIVLLVFKKWKVGAFMLVLAILGNWQFRCIPNHVYNSSDTSKTITVLSFNSNLSPLSETVSERRQAVVELIGTISPDVLFITENFYYAKDLVWEEIKDAYPYSSQPSFCVGNRIYSKYPILVDTLLSDTHMAYGINYCRIDSPDSPLDVFGVHLSSNNYNESMEYMTPDSVATRNQVKIYLNNIVNASEYREREALMMVDLMNKTSNSKAFIVLGDFNDVCGSPTLNILESAGLKDAWWKGGFGYGATIHDPLPFRIDHIVYNEGLILKSIKKVNAKGLSDHDALVATFSIK